MSSSAVLKSVRRLRSIIACQQGEEQSDEQLLTAFADRRDDLAFATLVRRHGPMVLGVCRRVLGHEQDAEDAFQATFLVLARRAAALRDQTALAGFLYGTAYHLASKAKRAAGRRRKYEGHAPARTLANPSDEMSWREVRTCLDEEVVQLPEKYRRVFVLCCLENVSRAEAARRLGVKEGTLSSRLTEARKRLQRQLARRGVELTAVLAAAALATPPASAVPSALLASTVKAVLAMAAGEGLAGVVPATVAKLTQGATAAVMVSKTKAAMIILLTVGLLTGAGVWAYRGLTAAMPIQPNQPPAAKANDKKAAPPKIDAAKTVELQVRVLDPDGKPKAGAKLSLLGKPEQLGATDEEGQFRIAIPNETKEGTLLAQADGCGLDFVDIPKGEPKKPIEFRLVKDRAIRGRIVNTEGKPAAGARLTVTSLGVYSNNSMDSFLIAWKKRHNMSGIPGGVKSIWSELGARFTTTTDADGRFVLRGLGEERLVGLRLRGASLADDELWIVNRDGFDPMPYNQAMLDNIPKGMTDSSLRWLLHGPDLDIVAETGKVLRGVVKASDTGKGRPGIHVHLARDSDGLMRVPLGARTDEQGRYEIRGAHKGRRYMIEVAPDVDAGYMDAHTWADDTPGYDPVTANITLKKGVIVTGKMIDKATGKPIRGLAMVAVLHDNPFVKEYPPSTNFHRRPTDADGTFRTVTIPGHVLLMGGPRDVKTMSQFQAPTPDAKYPQYFITEFPNFPSYYNPDSSFSPIQGNWCKVLDIKPDAKVVEQDIVLERAPSLPIRIQDAQGKLLTDVWVGGWCQDWYPPIQCKDAKCTAYQLEAGKPRLLVFFHPGRKLTGTLTLKGEEKPPVVAKLGPVGTIKGQLLDADGKPLAGLAVDVQYWQRAASEVGKIIHRGKQIVTDANGVFAIDDLIPEQKFELSYRQGKRKFERTPKLVNPTIEVKAGESRDLGTIKLKRILEQPGN
jgi:RNA polymerase sigma factor (sigma-70 family)